MCLGCGQQAETWNTGNKGLYCSRPCRAEHERKGREQPARFMHGPYWMLRWNVGGGKYVQQFEHRRVWEDAHGPIPDGYCVHHRNHDKLDNRIENLQLMRITDHVRHHHAKPDLYPPGATSRDYMRELRRRRKMA